MRQVVLREDLQCYVLLDGRIHPTTFIPKGSVVEAGNPRQQRARSWSSGGAKLIVPINDRGRKTHALKSDVDRIGKSVRAR
jgi:hypothetical protein